MKHFDDTGSTSAAKERIPFFDNLKGILIALVVIGHFFNGAVTANILPAWHIFNFIYAFHMPLFIFVSGIFCKSAFSAKMGFRAGAVLYYLALCWLMYLALWAPQAVLGVAAPLNFLTVDASMPWYLMALAIYCALTPLFCALKPAFAICCAFVLAVFSGLVDMGDTLSISRVITFLPFFLIGYYLSPDTIMRRIAKLGGKLTLARVCAAISIAAIFLGFNTLSLDQMQLNQAVFTGNEPYSAAMVFVEGANEIMCCAVRITGFALALLMGICLMLLTPRTEVFALSRTGRHTLQVYILHAFISYVLTYLGIAALMYQTMPPIAADIAIIVLGVLTSAILGWPNFIQRWFDRLKRSMDFFTRI